MMAIDIDQQVNHALRLISEYGGMAGDNDPELMVESADFLGSYHRLGEKLGGFDRIPDETKREFVAKVEAFVAKNGHPNASQRGLARMLNRCLNSNTDGEEAHG